MPIVYAIVAEGGGIIGEVRLGGDNFQKIVGRMLEQPIKSNRVSYGHDGHTFNMMEQDGVKYLCIAVDMPNRICFAFLANLRDEYRSGRHDIEDQMEVLMKKYSSPAENKIGDIKRRLDQTKDIMMDNIDRILERGEKLEDLVHKTDLMRDEADLFHSGSRTLKSQMCWKNYKLLAVIFGLVLLIIIIFIVILLVAVCGGGGCSGSN